MDDDKMIIVMVIAEFIQFATKSRSKIVKKNSWMYIGLLIKKQIKYKEELPSAGSSPSYAMGASNKKCTFDQSPQNMLDLLQSGLKKGIADSDKSTQAEAMSVLTMFTILDETRAERLISRMPGSVRTQYKKQNVKNKPSMVPKSKTVTGLVAKQKSKSKKHLDVLDATQITQAVNEKADVQSFVFDAISMGMDKEDEDNEDEIEYLSSTDSDTYSSGDSADSDSDDGIVVRIKKRPIVSIPSLAIKDDTDDDQTEETEDSETYTNHSTAKSSHIRSVSQPFSMKKSQKKKPFMVPSLNTLMSKSATIYDRNTNTKANDGRTRPNSARFGAKSRDKRKFVSLRPSSARASSQKMFDTDEEEDDSTDTLASSMSDASIDSDSEEDSESDTDDEDSDEDNADEDDEEEPIRTRDISGFREKISNGYMPKQNEISYDALLNEYHFDTTTNERQLTTDDDTKDDCLVCPSYSYARVDTTQILQHVSYPITQHHPVEEYLTIHLKPNVNQTNIKGRNKLNLVILLDQSGSMGSTFNAEVAGKSKMRIANECLCNLVDALHEDDRFALISFDDDIFIQTQSKLDLMRNIDTNELKDKIMRIKENGGTNFELAYEKANTFFEDVLDSTNAHTQYDNRIIMLTDACPNPAATNPFSLLHLFQNNSNKRIYTTFIGIGLNFNTDMVSAIHKQRGCNYVSVQSSKDFKQVLNDEFECHVTPLVFNVCLQLKTQHNRQCIVDIYGIDEKERTRITQSGEIQRIGTLFPFRPSVESTRTKGGMVLIKVKPNRDRRYTIHIQYDDRDGQTYEKNESIVLKGTNSTHYDNIGIRKGILLSRYCHLLKQWMSDDLDSQHNRSFLYVSEKWKNVFSDFIVYFQNEMQIIGDVHLDKEVKLLSKLVSFVNTQPLNKNNSPRKLALDHALPTSTAIQHSDLTDLIVSFLELKEPRITHKMIEFLSNEPTTTLFMSFLSRMPVDDDTWIATIDQDIDPTASITDCEPWCSEDINEIRFTQLSFSLMNILTNENYVDTVQSFLSRKCELICLHALAVFHPLSCGNAYHAHVILESILHSNPKSLLSILNHNTSIRKLLKCALFQNIHRGNMNAFFLDLICFQCPSKQKLYKQQTAIHHKKLLNMLCEWDLVPYLVKQCNSPQHGDDIASKFCIFFMDLTARCASVSKCAILFPHTYATLIVDELVGKGVVDKDNRRSVWTRVQCAQCMIQLLDLCSRPTVCDNANLNDAVECPNIFYALFEPLLARLHEYMPALCIIITDVCYLAPIATPHGIIQHPFGQIRLHCLELLTVASDFAQFECGDALAKIPISFFHSLLSLTFRHTTNNLFLVHFRRLIHLSMIFRRRILKSLFVEHDMLHRFIHYYNKERLHSDLSAYVVQMLFDFYDHDKLALEKEEKERTRRKSSIESFDDDEDEEPPSNFSNEPEDQWSVCKFFDSSDLWQTFKLTVVEEIDAQTAIIGDVPNWDMGQSSKLDDLISSLLRTEDDNDSVEVCKPFRNEIDCGRIPNISSISYFNIFNEYTFHAHQMEQRMPRHADQYLCFPSFSFAKSDMKYFLTVQLNMKAIKKCTRNKLNLAIVLDVSRSMEYEWLDDNKQTQTKSKIEYAIQGISNILSNLHDDDRIAMITFNETIDIHQRLRLVNHVDTQELIERISNSTYHEESQAQITDESTHPSSMKYGMDFENVFECTTKLFEALFAKCTDDDNEYDNRIILLSDYVPQSLSFVNLIKDCTEDIHERIGTSFISIGGCPYNASFVSHLLRNRGCSYHCPDTPNEYLYLTCNTNGQWDEIMTPLLYDLCLSLKPSDRNQKNVNCFNSIYGIKNEKKQKLLIQCGDIYKNHTLFLSHRSQTNGVIVMELNEDLLLNSTFGIKFELSFEDRDGRWYEFNEDLSLQCGYGDNNYYDNVAIRKSILLLRYITLIKERIEDEPKMQQSNSMESIKWNTRLQNFILYFENEMKHCRDQQLMQELNILHKLSKLVKY